MEIVPLTNDGSTGARLVEMLADNWVVALVADRDLGGRGVECEMFGRIRRFWRLRRIRWVWWFRRIWWLRWVRRLRRFGWIVDGCWNNRGLQRHLLQLRHLYRQHGNLPTVLLDQ